MTFHILVAISSHGYGHLAQVAPVLNHLRRRVENLRVTLRTGLPRNLLERRIEGPFLLQAEVDDIGMRQLSALEVDVSASTAAYHEWHGGWDRRVDSVAAQVRLAKPDLVFADVPYLTLAAAERAEVPSIALCSLNWMDIYGHYCGAEPEANTILNEMASAYRSAQLFLRPTPSMPMSSLRNVQEVGPIAQTGVDSRVRLKQRLGLNPHSRLVLVALGGIETRLAAESWPRLPGVHWIFQRGWAVKRDDALVLEEMGMGFSDLVASCDLFFTKPGYGSFAEAAAVGVPVLYVERCDWPESAALTEWLHRHVHAQRITHAQARSGDFAEVVSGLLVQGVSEPVTMTGIEEAAIVLERALVRQHGDR
jgi:hypothetical protein